MGAGFGRTGALSLKLALEQLGVGRCCHMIEVFQIPEVPQLWLDAAEGRPVDWNIVFRGFAATVDWPSATFNRQLVEFYPKAKVVLTVQDANAWFESTQATIFAGELSQASCGARARIAMRAVGDLFEIRMHDREHLVSVYDRYNAEARRVIPPERLLVYEVAEGWGPLCDFLELSAPDGPLPKVNLRDEFVDA